MSSYGAGLAIVFIAVVFSIASVVVVRRRVPLARLEAQRAVAGMFSSLLGTTYAIVVAFLVVVVWNDFSDTRSAVHAEANRLSDLARLAKTFEPPDEARARHALLDYGRAAIDQEWPAMALRRDSAAAWTSMQRLWSVYRHIEPHNGREQAAFAESLQALSDVSDYRHVRLAAAREQIAGVMWTLLIGGAVLLIMLTYFFVTESVRTHVAMTAALAILIGFNLFLIYALDHPFSSGPGISPAPLSEAVVRISDTAAE